MRVILIRLSALGDIVHTWPLAAELRRHRPELDLTWVVEEPLRPLVEGHPAVDRVISVATGRWRRRPIAVTSRSEIASLKDQFRSLQPELCIDAQGVFKSAVITRWTGAPRRVGLALPWRRERLAGLAYSETIAGSSDHPHVTATNLELMRALGLCPPADISTPDGSWLLQRLDGQVPPGVWPQRYAVILPGAGHPSKLLPVSTVAEVARGLVEDEGLPVSVVWGPGERERSEEIVAASGSGVSLAPPTSLAELTVVLAGAALVVGGDTGPVHLAASLAAPTLGVFLTTSEARNRPLGKRVRVVSATADTGTRPTGSARAKMIRPIGSDEILSGTRGLLERVAGDQGLGYKSGNPDQPEP
jgi:lipopolysaccharide heptosyltransferase I